MFSASKTAGPSGYNINNSLRFRKSASAYLSRTLGTPTDGKLWTWSGWVKRGALGSDLYGIQHAFSATNIQGGFYFQSDAFVILDFPASVNCNIVTTQVFRDPSAWYHLVVAVDTTQATASNRVKIYVNGSQITAFSTATYPTQNTIFRMVTSGNSGSIGRYYDGTSYYFDGYLAEYYFIDGQALTPSSFGSTNATTGVWQPKKYTGTYGTNGFYLPFSDIGLTSGSNTGLGKDFSGNSNYWTTNNISVTAGTTYDAMTDSPTLTSATVANYGVLNPLDKNTSITASDGNLTINSASTNVGIRGTFGVSSGKWYYEGVIVAKGGNDQIFGVALSTWDLSYVGSANGIGYGGSGYIFGAGVGGVATFTTGDIIGVAFDVDALTIKFYKNNVLVGAGNYSLPSAGTYFPAASVQNGTLALNFGQRPFAYTPPTGFNRLNTFNLPNSTIVKGNTVMDATTYTGTGSTQSITNAAGFRPDLVWVKQRNGTQDHYWFDSIRGATVYLTSTSTNGDNSVANTLTSFNSNGYSGGGNSATNGNGLTYVGWQWQAGQGTTSSNTAGSITSTVSVNATAGFSIVTYTGTGSAASIGHGLGVTPEFIIVKRRDTTANWMVVNKYLTNYNWYLKLNSTDAQVGDATIGNIDPTSTIFNVGTNAIDNASGGTYVAYVWAPIAGFSKFGSYTGNGSTDGPFVYTGFRPKYILVKITSTTDSWAIHDTSRSPYNTSLEELYPNLTNAESTGASNAMDILSNGFKLRGTSNNTNGATFIYAAFAENPFKNALAR